MRAGITVELVGGLGNQLFSYATAYDRATRLDCPLYLDTTWFKGRVSRNLEISQAGITGIYTHSSPTLRVLDSRIRKHLFPMRQMVCGTYVEKGFEFDEGVLAISTGTKIRGYFQSWRYFESTTDAIRKQYRSLTFSSHWYQEKLKEYSDCDPWLAVHVRRGDYLNPGTREFHGVLGSLYYREAFRAIDEVHGRLPFKVFSDDITSARALFSELTDRVEFVVAPADSSSLEHLLLMSMGAAIVTANSSFSWWAAWLGESLGRTVIVPTPWFRGADVSPDDLFLDSWTSIEAGTA